MWVTLVAVVLVVVPSPNSQRRLAIVPVELSVNETSRGCKPDVGPPVKLATGMNAPVPTTALVLEPPSAVVKTTALLKLTASVGLNITRTLVEPKPGKLNGVPERIVNPLSLTEAVPLVTAAPPRFVSTKLAWAFAPTATVPKFRDGGLTDNWAGVRPAPVTELVRFPPLLTNTTLLLKDPALTGANATATTAAWPGARV